MTAMRRLLRSDDAASGAEFAMVLPVLLLFLFGIIDGGRFLWEVNRAEKATQVGARVAVVTDMVAGGLQDFSFAINGAPKVAAGEKVGTDNFEHVTCDTTSCGTCSGSVCSSLTYNAAAFDTIVARMSAMYPAIGDDNVEVDYRNVGLGYSGDPNGPDVAPLVTVRLTDMEFEPITFMVFGGAFDMPDFRASLTLEDGSGTVSN